MSSPRSPAWTPEHILSAGISALDVPDGRLYAAAGNAVYEVRGDAWGELATFPPSWRVPELVAFQGRLWFTALYVPLWRSALTTWSPSEGLVDPGDAWWAAVCRCNTTGLLPGVVESHAWQGGVLWLAGSSGGASSGMKNAVWAATFDGLTWTPYALPSGPARPFHGHAEVDADRGRVWLSATEHATWGKKYPERTRASVYVLQGGAWRTWIDNADASPGYRAVYGVAGGYAAAAGGCLWRLLPRPACEDAGRALRRPFLLDRELLVVAEGGFLRWPSRRLEPAAHGLAGLGDVVRFEGETLAGVGATGYRRVDPGRA